MSICIDKIGMYHPENIVSNEYYANIFGNEIYNLLNHLGRKQRFIANEEETSLTLAVKAVNNCMKHSNITIKDIGGIVFVSDTPEYFDPPNALILKHMLGADNANLVYDINDACIGMITALDVVSAHMQARKKLDNVLVIGSFLGSSIAREDCPTLRPTEGDMALAMILKRTSKESGIVDSMYFTDAKDYNRILNPSIGMRKVLSNKDTTPMERRLSWIPHDVSFFSDKWTELIKKICNENNLPVEEVKHFLFSQFSLPDITRTLELLNIKDAQSKYTFVADKYGYTGCTSPFVAYYTALKDKKFKKGDTVVFCSVGGGYTMGALIYKV